MSTTCLRCSALLLALTFASGLRGDEQAKKGEDGKPAKKVAIHYERYGGFAGFHDNLRIFADYTFQLDTPPQVRHYFKGELSKDHQAQLAAHLKHYGKFMWEQSSGPRVVDGMKERLKVDGSGKAREENPKKLKTLLAHILVAARKGEKTQKQAP